ncbi:hypothetical protein PLESTF_000629700 [Pleodorina starrii]|nr:hypothetical protein PLESTF_000629700 [Pleodorina starrii]
MSTGGAAGLSGGGSSSSTIPGSSSNNNNGGGAGGGASKGRVGTPLRLAVEECQAEWFVEEMEEARSGNPVSMALVGQMLIQGYGCERELAAGREWVARALHTAEGKSDYAHLMAGWRYLYDNAEKQPVVSRGPPPAPPPPQR